MQANNLYLGDAYQNKVAMVAVQMRHFNSGSVEWFYYFNPNLGHVEKNLFYAQCCSPIEWFSIWNLALGSGIVSIILCTKVIYTLGDTSGSEWPFP